jgi:colanic acid/amylovoran biosynthesis glycosyltransferase
MTVPSRLVIGYAVGSYPELTQTFVLREIAGLRARGFEVIVFAVKRAPLADVKRSLEPPGGETVIYARPDRVWRHLWANLVLALRRPVRYFVSLRPFCAGVWSLPPRVFLRGLYHFSCGIGFVEVLRSRGVSHLHCHFTTGTNVALAVNLYAGVPFSFAAHASGDIYMSAPLLDGAMARARFVAPVCEYNRRYLNAVTGRRYSDKLHTIYNGIDLGERERLLPSAPSRPRMGAGDAELRIVSIGSLVVMKGHATLIEACALLRGRHRRIRCEIIGAGPEHSALARLIADKGLEDSTELTGPLPLHEVYAALARADVFALLSEIAMDGYRDGFPTVILEAMASKLPVVSTWISGTPEMVVDQETGFLVHERDAAAAADALERFVDDAPLRQRMGEAGRQRVADLFQFDRSADQLATLLRAAGVGGELPFAQDKLSHGAGPPW